jgi:hypothetical protein
MAALSGILSLLSTGSSTLANFSYLVGNGINILRSFGVPI